MSRQAATQTPEMGYQDYVASYARLARLEANDMPDFASMKNANLQKEMKVRRMFDYGKKLHMIARLEGHFRTMREAHERQPLFQAQHPRKRAELMLTSDFKEDSSRVSFTDLPGEIRNMIYDLALFASSGVGLEDSSDYAEAGDWAITAGTTGFFPGRSVVHSLGTNPAELRNGRTLSVLNVIAALNKQIRQEVLTFFWSHIMVDLRPTGRPSCCLLVCQFLEKIGSHGRSALAGLTVSPKSASYPDHHHQHYQTMMRLLRECKNLQTLVLYLPMYMTMGPPDRKAMQDFLLHGYLLSSPSKDDLVGTLHSLPKLRFVRLQTELGPIESRRALSNHLRHHVFLQFAFSGVREGRLVQEVRTRLQARQDVEFKIMGALDQVEIYEEWLPQLSAEGLHWS